MVTSYKIASLLALGVAAAGFCYGLSDSEQSEPGMQRDPHSWGMHLPEDRCGGRCAHEPGETSYFTQDEFGPRPGPPPRDERFGPPPRPRSGEGNRGPGGPPGMMPPPPPPPPPPSPLERVLDADQDGKISGEEMSQAAERLKKLDFNEDGELTSDEFAPPPPPPPGMHGPEDRPGPPGDRPPPGPGGDRRPPPPRGARPPGGTPTSADWDEVRVSPFAQDSEESF